MFTDGYVESEVKWEVDTPTLWVVTQNKNFEPPSGKKIFMEEN